MKQNKISTLGKTQLWRLRQDVVLNSMYASDYENRYGLKAEDVMDIMDVYVEYLADLSKDNNDNNLDILDIIKKYDSKDNLWNFRFTIDFDF